MRRLEDDPTILSYQRRHLGVTPAEDTRVLPGCELMGAVRTARLQEVDRKQKSRERKERKKAASAAKALKKRLDAEMTEALAREARGEGPFPLIDPSVRLAELRKGNVLPTRREEVPDSPSVRDGAVMVI